MIFTFDNFHLLTFHIYFYFLMLKLLENEKKGLLFLFFFFNFPLQIFSFLLQELTLAEENAQLYKAHTKRLGKLHDQYINQMKMIDHAKGMYHLFCISVFSFLFRSYFSFSFCLLSFDFALLAAANTQFLYRRYVLYISVYVNY